MLVQKLKCSKSLLLTYLIFANLWPLWTFYPLGWLNSFNVIFAAYITIIFNLLNDLFLDFSGCRTKSCPVICIFFFFDISRGLELKDRYHIVDFQKTKDWKADLYLFTLSMLLHVLLHTMLLQVHTLLLISTLLHLFDSSRQLELNNQYKITMLLRKSLKIYLPLPLENAAWGPSSCIYLSNSTIKTYLSIWRQWLRLMRKPCRGRQVLWENIPSACWPESTAILSAYIGKGKNIICPGQSSLQKSGKTISAPGDCTPNVELGRPPWPNLANGQD